MTRTDDTFVPLAERVHFARARQACAVHLDPCRRAGARRRRCAGRDDLYAVGNRLRRRGRAACREREPGRRDRRLDLSAEPGDVADILIDLARRETKTFSVQFARGLVTEMRNATRMHKDPLKSAGFRVLKAPDVPSVLVELGYVSNRGDLKSLTSEAWRSRTAASIAQAIDTFFATRVAGSRPANGQN